MSGPADITLFSHVANRPDDELDLAQAALLIAEPHYPSLDIPHYMAELDRLGNEARSRVVALRPGRGSDGMKAQALVSLLYQEAGFAGNRDDYYDPKNSFLNEVIDRRRGIPITLALVLVEVARRAGVAAFGIGFPGHFLVGVPAGRKCLYVDPFAGEVLTTDGLRSLYAMTTGRDGDPDPRILQAAPKAQILLRLLNNLRIIHRERGDREALRDVLLRIRVLAPTDGEVAAELDRMSTPPSGKPRVVN